MKVTNTSLQRLSEIESFQDLDALRDTEISLYLCKWPLLDVTIFNVFAPLGSAFFNFRGQKQLEDLSFKQGQLILDLFSLDEIESDLRSVHLDRGRPATFLLTGEITQHFGDYFSAFPDQFELFPRRHFSLAVPNIKCNSAIDFLNEQLSCFGESALKKCDAAESFVYVGIDDTSMAQRILSLSVKELSQDEIDFCGRLGVNLMQGLPGLWNDPCPIRAIDEDYKRAPAVVLQRWRELALNASFPVLCHWVERMDATRVYPADFSSIFVKLLSDRVVGYSNILAREI